MCPGQNMCPDQNTRPESKTETDRTLLSRRGLLTVLTVTPAVGTFAALSSPSNMSSGEEAKPNTYSLTDHVRTYYEAARY